MLGHSNKMFSFCPVASRASKAVGRVIITKREVHLKCLLSTGSDLLYRCQICGRPDPPLYARVWLCETMCDYPLQFKYENPVMPIYSPFCNT